MMGKLSFSTIEALTSRRLYQPRACNLIFRPIPTSPTTQYVCGNSDVIYKKIEWSTVNGCAVDFAGRAMYKGPAVLSKFLAQMMIQNSVSTSEQRKNKRTQQCR